MDEGDDDPDGDAGVEDVDGAALGSLASAGDEGALGTPLVIVGVGCPTEDDGDGMNDTDDAPDLLSSKRMMPSITATPRSVASAAVTTIAVIDRLRRENPAAERAASVA